jgi:hypothetical protein
MKRNALSPLAARPPSFWWPPSGFAALAWSAERDPSALSETILGAIADRERIAKAVLEEIAREDRICQSLLAVAPTEAAPKLTANLIRRDRTIEALVDMVETQSAEYRRIARELDGASSARRKRSPHRPL